MGFWGKVKGVLGRIGRGVLKAAPAIGAAIGSIVPGLGTAAGTAIGGAVTGLGIGWMNSCVNGSKSH